MRVYMSLCNRVTYIKTRMMSCISWIINIREADSDFMAKAIIILVMYFGHCPNCLSIIKDTLYIVKTIASLPITCNKSKKI